MKYLFLALAIVAGVSSFAQSKKNGSGQSKGKVVPCTHSIPVVTATTASSRCGRGTVNIAATVSGGTLRWYADETGGTSLGKGTSFNTPAISSTTTYYVSATDNGCTSTRSAVTAIVKPLPAKPVIQASGATELCEDQNVRLSVTTLAPSVLWSTGSTSHFIIATHTDDFTVTVTDSNGCSAVSAPVTVHVYPYPYITAITPGLRCGHGQNILVAKATAGMVRWYKNATDTAVLSYGTLYFTPTYITPRKDTFFVDANYRGCVSRRIAIPSVVNIPSIGSTVPASRNDAGRVLLKAIPKGGVINWYSDSIGGVSLGTDTLYTTPFLATTKKYYAEASSNGCSSDRKGVLATISCAATGSQTASLVNTEHITGIAAAEASSNRGILYVYPNPGKGHFTILSNKEGNYTIMDESGKAIHTIQLNQANNYTASNVTLSSGIYSIVGINNNQEVRQKLVVTK